MKRMPILALMCIALTSCTAMHQPPREQSPREITDHPEILYNHAIPPDQMTLRGVGLGDPRSAIAPARIDHEAAAGWIVCRDGCRYRVDDAGKVITLGVWDTRTLNQLNLETPDDIAARFGPAKSIDDAGSVQIYRYDNGHISVLWNSLEKQVNAVNVSK